VKAPTPPMYKKPGFTTPRTPDLTLNDLLQSHSERLENVAMHLDTLATGVLPNSTAATLAALLADHNTLLARLRKAGIIS
jgi:hypothetical protein